MLEVQSVRMAARARSVAVTRERISAASPVWLLPLVTAAVLLRLAVASRFPPHVDEGNMLLGIQTVAERGWPLLPSGVLYIHGATVSFLLAPLARLGLLDYADLFPLRAASAVLGGVAVWLTWRLARDVVGPGWPPLAAAALVAIDPFNTLWGGFVRMYALLQVLSLVVVWAFVRLIGRHDGAADPSRRRWLIALTVGYWLAVFTQAVGALLWPPLALVALILYGRRLLGDKRDLGLALAVAAPAPLVFVALSTLVGYGSTSTRAQQADAVPGASFLGDDALDFGRFLDPQMGGFQDLFAGGPASALVPILVVLATGLVVGQILLATGRIGSSANPTALGTLVVVFWAPVLLFAVAVAEQKPRYLLGVLPLAWILVVAAMAAVLRAPTKPRWPAVAAVAASAGVLLLHAVGGLWTMGNWGVQQTQGGVVTALSFVRDNRAPGDVSIVGSTPEAYLMLGAVQPMYAFGGVLERPGSAASGVKRDDWLAWEVIDSPADLCPILEDHPGAWFVLSGRRLDPGRATTDIALGATDQLLATDDGFVVLRSRPPAAWTPEATGLCARKAPSR
jgi:hypothetical protein